MAMSLQLAAGTPAFMAPELFQDSPCHSFSSDLWAFGVMLYYMRVGALPFKGTRLSDLKAEVRWPS